MSLRGSAIAVPNAVKKIATRRRKIRAIATYARFSGLNPARKEIKKTITPCITAMVAAPKVLPIIISIRETGATSVSLRNPNCLSRIISIHENIERKSTLIQMIPGVRN